MTTDYKSTVFLPRTDFPMKAGLPKREPEMLKRWERMDIQARQREAAKGRGKWGGKSYLVPMHFRTGYDYRVLTPGIALERCNGMR